MSDLEKIRYLKDRRADLGRQMQAVAAELDTYRVKCPTCRCRILPGDECDCCASAAADAEIADLLDPTGGDTNGE